MKAAPSAVHWLATVATSTAAMVLLANPRALPEPAESVVRQSVDGVARACLWAWDEPVDGFFPPIPLEPDAAAARRSETGATGISAPPAAAAAR